MCLNKNFEVILVQIQPTIDDEWLIASIVPQ